MSTDMSVHAATAQQAQQVTKPEVAARTDEQRSNTSLIEIQDKVHLSPEGRALLARMEEAGQADA